MSRRRKVLIVFVVVVVLATLMSVIRHYQLRFTVEAYVAELKAKGEPMELAQVIPPPVPSEQNGADIFRNADTAFIGSFRADENPLETNYVYGMEMVAPGKAMIRWQQPDIRDIDGTNSWENVTAVVVQNAKAFALLQQIIEKPAFDFKIKYGTGVADLDFINLDFVQSKRAAQRLETAVLCDLHQGDTASAVKNLRAMLALVKAMRNERLVISELVRMALAQITLTANWEFLQSTNQTDEQLAELQQDWMSLDFVRGAENAMAMERVIGRITTAKWRRSNSILQDYIETVFRVGLSGQDETILDKLNVKANVFFWRYWWSYPDELRALKSYDVFLGAAHLAETNYSFQTAITNQRNGLKALKWNKTYDDFYFLFDPMHTDFHSLISGGVMGMSAVFDKTMRTETAKQMMVTAIALKRYQLKHGNYPADLNSLVREFLPAVTLDPVDGQPLRYRRNADGTFVLYSVGENGVDHGGDPSLEKGITSSNYAWQNTHALDWVWPQPATEEEVQKYYEVQGKKSRN
jgi:hypothetical protein